MATSTFTPGSYTVSGISPARTGIAESFQAGLQANLGRQTTRQQMQERDQMMKLRELQEQRTQAQFEAQQRAAAAAAARAAQERAAFAAYTRAVTAEPTVPTAGVRRPWDDFRASGGNFPLATPPQRSPIIPELGFPSPAGTTPTAPADVQFPSVFNQTSAAPADVQFPSVFNQTSAAGGVQVASLDPTESFRAAFQARPDLFGGGVQVADASGALPAGADTLVGGAPTRTFMTPESMAARAGMAGTLAGYGIVAQPTRTRYRGVDFDVYPDGRIVNTLLNVEVPATDEFADLRSAVQAMASGDPTQMMQHMSVRPETGRELPEYVDTPGLGTMILGDLPGQANADRYLEEGLINEREYEQLTRGSRSQQWDIIATAVRRRRAGETAPPVPETVEAQTDQVTAASGTEPASPEAPTTAEAPAEPRTPPERTGRDPFIVEEDTPTGPIAGLSPAGAANPVMATEAAAAAAPGGDTSAYLISNPNLVLDLQTQLARERQVLEARLEYAQQTGNRALFDQTFDALNSRERVVNENMIAGQIAILAAQQDNFGPLQELMQRAYPNDNIEVIPYTNGTVSFFINGQESGEPQRTLDLLSDLAQEFNTEYRDALAAAAQITAGREQFLFENIVLQQLQAEREISVEQAKALAEIEATYGKATYVSDMESGDKLFQVLVPGRGYVMFRIVEAGQPLLNGKPAASATVEEIPQGALR